MSRLNEEMRVIPWGAWAAAGLSCVALGVYFMFMLFPRPGFPFAIPFLLIPAAFFLTYLLLAGYVYGDAKRRGMRYVMWMLLVMFIPSGIGFILYFIMRDPPMRICTSCSKALLGRFTFCPACGATVAPSCPDCRQAIEPGWSHCPSCGKGLREA